MTLVLRGMGAFLLALGFAAGTANADNLVWSFVSGDGYAFIGVVEESEAEEPEAHHPFLMSCSTSDGDQTVVSDVDPKVLGEAIANNDIPSYTYVLDGKPADDAGREVADIHFGQMEGVWEYVSYGAPYDFLLDASSIKIEGVGVSLALPEKDLKTSLQQFKTACDALAEGRSGD